ncbi:cytosine/adenosine deaminases [Clostridium sp. CAG:1193]|jgi:tRNA(adenine34) deaminase|nr:cytosine/adenosine deaminases [Clostridium sp. CAG:1193]
MKEKNMKEAIKEAIKAYEMKEMPVGAVVVYNGEIIGKGYNKKEFAHDSTMHAEIIAIKEACKSINDWRLNECTIYVTMEPCPMCIGAIKEARIKDVICGIKNDKFNKLNEIIEKELEINIEIGVCEDEIKNIVKKFFISIRNR